MSDEHLWKELKAQEEADDMANDQSLASKIVKSAPKPIDADAALARYHRDFKPVFNRRSRARSNPVYRAFLKATGQWTDLDAAEAVKPTKGFVPIVPNDTKSSG